MCLETDGSLSAPFAGWTATLLGALGGRTERPVPIVNPTASCAATDTRSKPSSVSQRSTTRCST